VFGNALTHSSFAALSLLPQCTATCAVRGAPLGDGTADATGGLQSGVLYRPTSMAVPPGRSATGPGAASGPQRVAIVRAGCPLPRGRSRRSPGSA
jgi:hypothetical protein